MELKAFPCQTNDRGEAFAENALDANGEPFVKVSIPGMDLRDYMAVHLAAVVLGKAVVSDFSRISFRKELAEVAYSLADDMIKARKGGAK